MEKNDRQNRFPEQIDRTREPQRAPRPAPGKVTLTSKLSPDRGSAVQRKASTPTPQAAAPQTRSLWDLTMDPWMDAAHRGVTALAERDQDLAQAAGPIQAKGLHESPEASLRLPGRGGGIEMPEEVRGKMETAFGMDFSSVRIHEGPHAQAIGALAYTQGTDIHFAPGQYQPRSHPGQELLGHELTHVVQQSQGRVQTTTQAKGIDINDDASLEHEADVLGARAARGGRGRESSHEETTGLSIHGGLDEAGNAPEQQTDTVAGYVAVMSGVGRPVQRSPQCGPAVPDLGAVMCDSEAETEAEVLEIIRQQLPELAEREPGLRQYDRTLADETRARYRIPARGWTDTRHADGATRRIDLSSSLRTLVDRVRQDRTVAARIRETLDNFYNDPDPDSRLRPGDIDLALVLAIANRESAGSPILLSDLEDRVVTAGPDTYPRGRGGLDYVGQHRDQFPSAIRHQVVAVQSNPRLRARLLPNRAQANPAELRQRDLLAAYIVEVRARTERFERLLRDRAEDFLTPAQIDQLLASMSTDARRAWIQASFGSRLPQMLSDTLRQFRHAMRSSRAPDAFQTTLANDQTNLNAILNNDRIMDRQGLAGHRTRITAAEASMLDQTLPPDLLRYGSSGGGPTAGADAEPLECAPPEDLVCQ